MYEWTYDKDTPVACDPARIAPQQRERWEEVSRAFFRAVEGAEPLDDGFIFHSGAQNIRLAAEYVDFESRCCPFIQWTLGVAQERRRLWLSARGPDGTKALIREVLIQRGVFDLNAAG